MKWQKVSGGAESCSFIVYLERPLNICIMLPLRSVKTEEADGCRASAADGIILTFSALTHHLRVGSRDAALMDENRLTKQI